MKNKTLILLIVIFAVILIGAAIAYNHFADQTSAQQLATLPPQAETTPPATTAATQATTPVSQAAPPETTQPEQTQPEAIPAPDFTVFDFDGNEVHFIDYVGKPIVLNFWATWCGPCRSEMPEFNKVYEDLGGEVVFLMVNAMEEQNVVQDYITEQGFTFPVFLDTLGSATGTYGINSYPTTFFIDAQGNLVTYAIGAIDEETLMIGVDMIYTP